MTTRKKAQHAPELLCQILSPYSSTKHVGKVLKLLLDDEELLDLIIELANRYFLIPTFYSQLCSHELEKQLSEELLDFLVEMTNFMQERSKSLVSLTEEIVAISNKEGITPLLIKGSGTLFSDMYPDTGIRFMSDLDILFKEKDALIIFSLLQTYGFSVPEKYMPDIKPAYLEGSLDIKDLPLSQHLLPLYREGTPCGVEIHHRPLSQFFESYLSSDLAFSSASKVEFLSKKYLSAFRMTPENEVVYCFSHSERAHRFHEYHIFDIRQMDFFVRLVYTNQENLDWSEIYRRIERTGEAEIFQYYLQSINQLFDVNFPIDMSLSINKKFNEHYKKGISSCFPKYSLYWKLEFTIAETASIFSRKNMSNRYNITTKKSLFFARLFYTCALIKKYSNPAKFFNRVKYSVRYLLN